MLLEDQRYIHEDLERLEQGISDRALDEPKHIRDRLSRDHQIAGFLDRIHDQSKRLLDIYKDADGARSREIQAISTGDPFDEFYKQLNEIKDFHRRYPNEPVENLERAYKKRAPAEGETVTSEVDNMFTGEEGFGRFWDLHIQHERYLNLPGIKRISYLQYLDTFDIFAPPQCLIKRTDKRTETYFKYVSELADYLENFMRRTRPLEDLDKVISGFDEEFIKEWEANSVAGWEEGGQTAGPAGPVTEGTGEGIWCADCEKEFKNENVYRNHITGKKHIRAAEEKRKQAEAGQNGTPNGSAAGATIQRLKDRAIAEREFRVQKLAKAMQDVRSDTRVNVERKQGMTERERQMELDALFSESTETAARGAEDESDEDEDERLYNPLKLPMNWDGKPIPFWLYKLHGLGLEFNCEICGNFVYQGRRAFDKHFNEARHLYGLKCLGITNATLFREITGIEDALKLWEKIQRDKKQEKASVENVVQMEDAEGNVMPEKVYYDLQKQGLL
ncbi:splicing factor 3a subunit 3 [Xylona heveae TC161]|uniref:Splicing factor 3a subunit 3 n=1 Tax=Xylona heveae (strain CBS 132557 / TC161) TaxID=1328760 RepID=A0A165ABJ3_XYLHT|nr:splicing factor 3a subunit 3 [Xylona heveae TC161]KZF20214.1 splicing factor 3a subunit 3 [Xylona heveae TC161]